jgi:hypothetical protein
MTVGVEDETVAAGPNDNDAEPRQALPLHGAGREMRIAKQLAFALMFLQCAAGVSLAASDTSPLDDRPPEGLFRSIETAHGQEMVMGQLRSFEIVPVRPARTFTADVPEIFVVFRVFPHYNSYRVLGRWFVEKGEGVPANFLLGRDAMSLAAEDDSGYLLLKRPAGGWPIGDYKVEIHVGEEISGISHVGTLRFTVLRSAGK